MVKLNHLKDLNTKKIVPNLGWNILDFKKNKKMICFKNQYQTLDLFYPLILC